MRYLVVATVGPRFARAARRQMSRLRLGQLIGCSGGRSVARHDSLLITSHASMRLEYGATDSEGNSITLEYVPCGELLPRANNPEVELS